MIDCILERKNKRKMLNSFCNQGELLKVKKITYQDLEETL